MGFQVLSLLMIVGVILEASAITSFWQLAVGRIIVYSGIGLASNVVLTYLSECAPQRVRGAFLALYSFFTSLGVFIASLVVYLSRSRTDKWQYLIVICCQLFVPVGYLIAYPFLPESPRYLVYRGRFTEAEEVMRRLSNHREAISQEIQLLKLQIEEQRELHKATSILDCFKDTNLRRTVAAMGVQIFQQAQGVSFIQNFIVTFMQQLGFPDPLRTNLLVTGCSFACHVLTFITFDKLGRRWSLLIGSIGMAATMLGTGGAIESGHAVADLSIQAKNACAALLILWYCIYGFTWGPGCWIVTGEIGTGQLRERTIFLASMGSFLTSVPINFVNPYVQKAIGGRVTFIYGAFSIVSILFVWMCVPETRRRSLEELDEMFQAHVPTWKFNNYVCTGMGAEITRLEHGGKEDKPTQEEIE
ncbi:high-affinity glucose transporter [Penicillium daleae]|uniref:High-affinity glucose transporter n=1 Tax=Penicillium daleae TaxID=63821 RepID=A0AAD6CGR2_9EURO|nr:high-affinity glucose transporter [Penicillium daleae]KAJ5461405.1 high-affinity glucose transporter [Penicillium daleae]